MILPAKVNALMKKLVAPVLLACLSTTSWLSHAASGSPDVVVLLQVRKVVLQRDGSENLVEGEAAPGDLLEYQATYTNRGAVPARDVQATLPVPETGIAYVSASAAPGGVLASVDGKAFAPAPLQRIVSLPDGKLKSEAVPVSQYRYLRWHLGDLDPGKIKIVRSRMRLIGSAMPGAAVKSQEGAR